MGDGINYIVDIAVTVDGGEPLNLKTVAFVPRGASKSEKVVLDPVSTVVAEAVAEKVKNGFFETGGDTFSQDYISDLKETMAAAVEEVISNNTDFDLEDFSSAIGSEGGVGSLVSKLLADEEVNSSVNKLEDAAVAEKYEVPETVESNDDARARVADLFEQLDGGDGGGAPGFIIKFFGDRYAESITKTVDQIFTAIWAGVEIDDAAQASEFSKAGALNAFTGELDFIFASLDRIAALEDADSLTTAEKTELAELYEAMEDVPDIILGIFPPSKASEWLNLSATSTLTVPQAITLVFYTLDVYLEDLRGYERNDDGSIEETDGADFNPEQLLVLYGFNPEDATQAAEYASLDVNWLELHPGQVWLSTANGGTGGQVDILSLYTCVDAYPEERFVVDGVSLTYPKGDGTTGSVDLNADMYGHGSCYNLNPWDLAHQLEEDFKQNNEGGGNDFIDYDGIWNHLVNQDLVITDFTSGTYTVTVTYADGNTGSLTKEVAFNKRVITGLSNLFPRFTSPNGLPKHPEPNSSQEEWDAFNTAQAAFEMTTFPSSDAVTFSWTAPTQLATTPLPEGVAAVYNVDVGRDVCGDDPDTQEVENYCRWEHVFSSWELGGQIFGTTFELPAEVKGRLTELAITDTPYQANLSISFVDEETGEHLGQGGWTSAPFRVGAALDLDATFNLMGSVSNAPDANAMDGEGQAYPISAYKVAAVQEECYEDTTQDPQQYQWTDENGVTHTETWYPWVCEINTLAVSALTEDTVNGGHTYTLQPTLRQMMNSGNAWIDIRLFIDADGDNLVDGHVPGTEQTPGSEGEMMYWSHGNPPNFNNWGGVLRIGGEVCEGEGEQQQCFYQDQIVVPDGDYDGPDFDTQPYSGGEECIDCEAPIEEQPPV